MSEYTMAVFSTLEQGQADFQRVRALVAEEKGIKVGDDTLDHLLDQVVEMLMHSGNGDMSGSARRCRR